MNLDNKLKQLRNNRILKLRDNLKTHPILHNTTDRIKNMIKFQQSYKQNAQNQTQEQIQINLQLSESKIKGKSQKSHDFQSKFIVGQKIGQGAHSVVKKCYHKQTNKLFALKIINSDNQQIYYLKRNFIYIKQLDHPNVIQYKACYFDNSKQKCLIVMDYLQYPNLSQIKIQSEDELRSIVYEVILGLEYIHQNNICHRDIKPQNILYDKENKKCILIDFGVSRQFFQRGTKKQLLTLTGTPYYRAPEMFEGGGYDQQVDLWSLGVLIYKLVTGVTPFESEYHSDTINNIRKGQVHYNQQIWSKYSHLVKNLVVRLLKPKQLRLTIRQAKKDFWFQKIKLQHEEQELTKSSGFQWSLSLKRQTTDVNNGSFIRHRNPSISPQLTGLGSKSPVMFNLQKYQKQQQNMKWLNLQGNQQLDFIQSEEQESTIGSSPTLRGKNSKSRINIDGEIEIKPIQTPVQQC